MCMNMEASISDDVEISLIVRCVHISAGVDVAAVMMN